MKLAAGQQGLTNVEHRALKSVAVQFFVNGAVLASYIPRLPDIRDSLGLTLTQIGAILAVATGVGIVGSALQGPAIESFGTRKAMIFSSFVLVAGLAFVGAASNVWVLIAALMVIAVSDVVTDVAMNIQGSTLSARRSTPVINRLHGLWSLGTVVGGTIAAASAAAGVSLSLQLFVSAGVLALALLYVAPGLLTIDEDVAESGGGRSEQRAQASNGWVMVTFLVLGGSAIIPEVITSDWAAFRLADDLGTSNGFAGLGFVAFTTGMVIGRFAADSIVSRMGSDVVLRVATLLAAVGIVLAMVIPIPTLALVGLNLAGLGVSVMFPQLYDMAVRSGRSNRALAGLTAGSRIALLATPLLVGFLAGSGGFTVGAAVVVTTIPAALVVLSLTQRLQVGTAVSG